MSTNVSKEKREQLKTEIKALKDFVTAASPTDEARRLLSYISDLENAVNGKKYGLIFERHRETVDELLTSHVPVLTEDAALYLDNGGQANFIIEGDNLASLKLLEKTRRGAIDLIYIDPPYNTGKNDFAYDDSFVDENDTFRHSKWLSFMEKRLETAARLLNRNGIIFISIDDNELSQLKILCDGVFGESNRLLTVCVNRPSEIASNYAVSKHEYLLAYVKDMSRFQLRTVEKYSYSRGTVGNKDQTMPVIEFPAGLVCKNIPDGVYEQTRKVEGGMENIENLTPIVVKDGKLAKPVKLRARWRSSNDMRNFFKNGCNPTPAKINGTIVEIFFENDKFNPQIKKKTYEKIPSLYLENKRGSDDLKELGLDGKFGFPKSVKFISYILSLFPKDCTVLDFFAGSGTTGHAVLELNADDGGTRKFILCTNNENDICRSVTYERIKRAILKNDYKAGVKYCKVEYIPVANKFYYEYADRLLGHMNELAELENGVYLNNNPQIAVLLNEEEVAAFIADEKRLYKCKKIYLGHDALLDGGQERLLEEREIELNVIPEYYYEESEN